MNENVYLFILMSPVRMNHIDIDQEVIMEFDHGTRFHYAVSENVQDVYQYLLSLNLPFAFDFAYDNNDDNDFTYKELELRHIDNNYQLVDPYNDKISLYNLSDYEKSCIKYNQLMKNI